MSKAHTVVTGDTFVSISVKYYGTYSKWTSIRNANPQLASRNKAGDGTPLIFPGDILIIPEELEIPAAVANGTPSILDERAARDISIFIDGKLFTGFTGYRLTLPIDTMDAFSFSAPWQDDIDELHKVFQPFKFKQCAVYYDRELVFSGRLLTSAPEVSPESKTITIQGYPLCGVLSDCCIPESKYPPAYAGMTLQDIATDAAEPFGIEVEFDRSSGDEFADVAYEPGTKILDFLKKLAEQRGFIFTNTPYGMLRFWQPQAEAVSATFGEGSLPYISCKPTFAAQGLYSHVTGFTKTAEEADATSYTYENKYLIKAGIFRPLSFTAADADSGSIEAAVLAQVGRMYADCMSYELTVVGHRDKNGNLYRKNMMISIYSPGAMIYRDTRLQVYQVDLVRSDTEGDQAIFKLILPGSMDGEIPEVLPWDE